MKKKFAEVIIVFELWPFEVYGFTVFLCILLNPCFYKSYLKRAFLQNFIFFNLYRYVHLFIEEYATEFDRSIQYRQYTISSRTFL